MSSTTFLGMAQELMLDADAKAAFEADPDGFLAARGFEGLSPEDVTDAVGYVAETLPPGPAEALTGPDAPGDALTRLAQVEPSTVIDSAETPPEPVLLLETDPSGELDLSETSELDDDEPRPEVPGDGPGSSDFAPLAEAEADPGFGVGYNPEDADDVLPTDMAGAVVDLDATLVPELAPEPGDVGHALAFDDLDHLLDLAHETPDGPGLDHGDVDHHGGDGHGSDHGPDHGDGIDLDL